MNSHMTFCDRSRPKPIRSPLLASSSARAVRIFALLLLVTTALWSRAAEQPEGTRRMIARLRQWQEKFGDRNPYKNVALIQQSEEQLRTTVSPPERLALQLSLINEYLNVGDPEKSLGVVTNLLREMNTSRFALSPKDRRNIRLLEGLAYLRLGELENCIGHHNPDSCLLPIRNGGQHARRRGAENAEGVFTELANQRPSDLGIRWLLNVSAMILGHYPDGVPARHRIPESIFKSEVAFPRFAEIGTRLDLDSGLAGGTITDDFDGDGQTDILLSNWDPMAQCHLYRNLGNGRFEEVTEKALLTGVTGGLNIMQMDYNNDGWLDFYIVRGAWMGELGLLPNSLMKNNGDGTFSDVTEEAGLLAFHPALSAAWFDANNDGWLDLFVGCETQAGGPPHTCLFYVNNRNGTFTEQAATAGIPVQAFVRGVSAGDFDNDGWPDIYLSCLGRTNILFRNLGPAGTNNPAGVRFTEVTALAGVGEPILSFPTWFWDYDNDGWLDLWVSGYGADARAFFDQNVGHFTLHEIVAMKLGQPSKAETPRLYRNKHDGTFADVTKQAGLVRPLLTMGANFGDIDTDGYLDFYAGTGSPYFGSLLPNEMYRNNAGKTFQDVTTAGGFGHLQKGHGIAFADLNNDGHQEVVANMGGAFAGDNFFDAIFANPGNSNHWIKIKLVGSRSNRAAIGARIKVVAHGPQGSREIHRMVCSGGSFGASPLRQEIGLGSATDIDRVEVWWPTSGLTNRITSLAVDKVYRIKEGENSAESLPSQSFALPANPN
jgi:hypothetical protein